jgi:GNAT superfamily N-acetyltransferase
MSVHSDEIVMVRDHLRHIPQFALPAPYTLRWYRPGDAQHWIDIHTLADVPFTFGPELFRKEFGFDEQKLAQRQAYVVDDADTPIGTASAWTDDPNTAPQFAGYGRVHWVAILPEHQGKGLSRPLLQAVLERLRDLGHTQAYLDTASHRPIAIHLYERFGFRLYIT